MQKRMKLLKNQKGMTLVELLAVLVILGIIAAIAVPMIGNAISESKQKGELNDALNIIAAAKLADANGEALETVGTGGNGYTKATLTDKGYLDDSVSEFTGVTKSNKGQWTLVGFTFSKNDKYKGDRAKTPSEANLKKSLKELQK
mgnify:FL=1